MRSGKVIITACRTARTLQNEERKVINTACRTARSSSLHKERQAQPRGTESRKEGHHHRTQNAKVIITA
jgi:hypothetical protein